MSGMEVFFKGLLANVDSSVLGVDFLEHGFEVEPFSADDAIDIISKIGLNPNKLFLRTDLEHKYNCVDYSKSRLGDMYFISASFEDFESARNKVENYLMPVVKLMRLFKEGAINIPMAYYYSNDESAPENRSFSLYPFVYCISKDDRYSLETSEMPDLARFVEDIITQNKEPNFKDPILKIAHDLYDLSYHVPDTPTALLNLMISLESLLNPAGGSELRYRISRNAAILIGNDKEYSKDIYMFIKDMYAKRSKLVHTGKVSSKSSGDELSKEDIEELRDYVRRSIIKFNEFIAKNPSKKKKDLLDILEFSDFGEPPC